MWTNRGERRIMEAVRGVLNESSAITLCLFQGEVAEDEALEYGDLTELNSVTYTWYNPVALDDMFGGAFTNDNGQAQIGGGTVVFTPDGAGGEVTVGGWGLVAGGTELYFYKAFDPVKVVDAETPPFGIPLNFTGMNQPAE